MEIQKNWRGNWILLGGITGALLGIITAYLIIKSAEQKNTKPQLSASKGMQLGMGVVSLIKNFINLSQ